MVYGLPKSGKSTMCLDFANHLASNHGKVLYCAVEEGFGYTLKEKIERLGAQHANLYITDRVLENLSDYQFVFIDSVSKAGMDVEDIELVGQIWTAT
jgi:predicted ATP-dependent serine protease